MNSGISRLRTPFRAVPCQRMGRLLLRDLPLPAGKFGVSWMHERLPRHSRTPAIYHKSTEEVVFILKGRVVVHLDGRHLVAGAGDTLSIPAGTVHAVASGKDAVEVLSLFSPPMDLRRPDAHMKKAAGAAHNNAGSARRECKRK